MKKIIITVLVSLSIVSARSQDLADFFSQKKADIQYMLDQIAAFQVYIGYAEKGYDIAQKGLTFIGELKKGEFDLHNAFFSSLKAVNPSISKYSKVADIISYQLTIIKDFKQMLQVNNLTAPEINYLTLVYNNMSDECTKSLNDLIDIIADNTYEMKDNDRIKMIDAIYLDMKDKYAFTQSFTSEAILLSAQRTNETNEIDFLKTLN